MNIEISKRVKGKAKIEKDKETVKPTIINDSLITYYFLSITQISEYLITYNKENRIYDSDDMPLWELTHLALSYKSISHILILLNNLNFRYNSDRQLAWSQPLRKALIR